METVLRDTAGSIAFETGLRACATEIGMTGTAFGIEADEYRIVVFR